MRRIAGEDAKIVILTIVAGLAVAYVRHDLIDHAGWESLEQFFVWWFIHTLGLGVYFAAVAIAISLSHEFFLGYKFEEKHRHLFFYVLMAVMVASVCVWLLAHHVFAGDDFD
ncbi:MAG TPA: hypothetical protein VKX28_31155 [Xanthobacteraceae bacterium]|nr:hypothetical protein [Xanthobacteraceae bacterium]